MNLAINRSRVNRREPLSGPVSPPTSADEDGRGLGHEPLLAHRQARAFQFGVSTAIEIWLS
jgi:hypothetical protein